MKTTIKTDTRLTEVFTHYPDFVRPKMEYLRGLVSEKAEETEGGPELQEPLKMK